MIMLCLHMRFFAAVFLVTYSFVFQRSSSIPVKTSRVQVPSHDHIGGPRSLDEGVCSYYHLYQTLGGHMVLDTRLLHCTQLLGTHGSCIGSAENKLEHIASGNLPTQSLKAVFLF